MFNHWKEYLTFHASIEETKLSQHLEELHKKLKAEIRAKRMIADRRKLAKVAYEKRKKEREERERLKEKPKIDATRFAFNFHFIFIFNYSERVTLQYRIGFKRPSIYNTLIRNFRIAKKSGIIFLVY